MDAESQLLVAAHVEVLDPRKRDHLQPITTKSAEGGLLLSLLLGRQYIFFVEAEGYFPYTRLLDLSNKDTTHAL